MEASCHWSELRSIVPMNKILWNTMLRYSLSLILDNSLYGLIQSNLVNILINLWFQNERQIIHISWTPLLLFMRNDAYWNKKYNEMVVLECVSACVLGWNGLILRNWRGGAGINGQNTNWEWMNEWTHLFIEKMLVTHCTDQSWGIFATVKRLYKWLGEGGS